MDQQQLQRRRRNFEILLWPLRLVLVVGVFVIWLKLLFQSLPTAESLPLGALTAAIIITFEVYLTARIRGRSLRDVAVWRLLMLDHLLSRPGDTLRAPAQEQAQLTSAPPSTPSADTEDVIDSEAWDDEDWPA
jgi:hypothetical protein